MVEIGKKITSIFESEKTYIIVFWVVLSGIAIYFAYLTIVDWAEVMSLRKWVDTNCQIIESRVEEEGGKEWANLFVVRYQYLWDGEPIEGHGYKLGYDGSSVYPDPNELIRQYPVGMKTKCFVNPADPTQAVLEKESALTIFFLLLPLTLFIVCMVRLYAVWNPASANRLKRPPQTRSEETVQRAWKFIKWVAMILGFILLSSVGLWAVIGFAAILFLFFGFPLLFASAMSTQIKEVGDELAKLQTPQDSGYISRSGKAKLHFTDLEKTIIVIAAIIFTLIMAYFIKHNKGTGIWSIFGIMFMTMWFGGVITIITYAVLKGLRQYRQDKFRRATTGSYKKADVPPGIKVMKIAAELLAFIGIGGFLAGFVCAFVTMSGKPRVSSWARFPLGELESVVVDSKGNIYCGLDFYSRIQAYSPEGKFLRGWFLDAGGGVFRMKIDKEDHLHVGTARGDNYYLFNTKGELLSSKEMSPKEEERIFGDRYYNTAEDIEGNIYKIRNGTLLPRVVKVTSKGEETVVVSDPFYLWFIKGPFPAFIWIPLAFVLITRLDKYQKT